MTLWRLIARGLAYYWRTNLLVTFGVAVAAAALTGSLLVGDSVTWSIRHAALARLGAIEHALTARGVFRAQLAGDLAARVPGSRVAAVLMLDGVATHAESHATVPHVTVIGADAAFWACFPGPAPSFTGRQVALSAAAARDLGAREGDALLLRLPRTDALAPDLLFAHRQSGQTERALRVTVAAILPDLGVGGFRLAAGGATPRNIFIDRALLATAVGTGDQANVMLADIPGEDARALDAALAACAAPADYGLAVYPYPARGAVGVETAQLAFAETERIAVEGALARAGLATARTSVYLATDLRRAGGGAGVPYSLLAAVEPMPPVTLVAGGTGPLGMREVWLNAWTAEALAAKVGDRLDIDYLISGADGEYRTRTVTLTVTGIVAMRGIAADAHLTPHIPGLSNADTIGGWEAPFPIDMGRITPRDEAYWQQYRATPKAFISPRMMQALWRQDTAMPEAGWVTALRVAAPGSDTATLASRVEAALRQGLAPGDVGRAFRPVRRMALAAAAGTTDFAQLFLGMSLFLIFAALGMAGTLLRLSAHRRAASMGLMLAAGLPVRMVTGVIVGEGAALTVLGTGMGVPLGVLYAGGIVYALGAWWRGATGDTALWLHVAPSSLAIGALASVLAGLVAVAWGARGAGRRPVLALLAGWQAVTAPPDARGRAVTRALAVLGAVGAIGLIGASMLHHGMPSTTAFFGGGALLLVSGLCLAHARLAEGMAAGAPFTLSRWVPRNMAVHRGRGLLVIGLLATAAFLVITVAANGRDFARIDAHDRAGGTAGYALRAIAALPVRYDFGTARGRAQLGFDPRDEAVLAAMRVTSVLMSPGEDVSCLNLARPSTPRLLGLSEDALARISPARGTARGRDAATDTPIDALGDADSVQWTLHAGQGKPYTFALGDGRAVTVRFVGLLPGSIFGSEILIPETRFRQLFPEVTAPRYFLIECPRGQEGAVAAALRRNLGEQGLEVRETREILNAFSAVQNAYLSVFLALGGLGMLLGTVGLVVILLRNALERRREFALLLALGFSRAYITRLLVAEHAGLLIAGLALGSTAALIATLPQTTAATARVDWPAVAGLLLAMLLAGGLSTVLAARAAARDDLSALREE